MFKKSTGSSKLPEYRNLGQRQHQRGATFEKANVGDTSDGLFQHKEVQISQMKPSYKTIHLISTSLAFKKE